MYGDSFTLFLCFLFLGGTVTFLNLYIVTKKNYDSVITQGLSSKNKFKLMHQRFVTERLQLDKPCAPCQMVLASLSVKDKVVAPRALNISASPLRSRTVEKTKAPTVIKSFSVWNGNVPLVVDQGEWGSCTAFSMRYAYMLYKAKLNQTSPVEPSTAFWYAQSRMIDSPNRPLSDDGSYIHSMVKVLQTLGTPTNNQWPYTSKNIFTKPPEFSSLEKIPTNVITKIPTYSGTKSTPAWQVQAAAVQNALASGKSVLVGILVYSNFMTDKVLVSGVVPMPSGYLLGGHAICLTGFTQNSNPNLSTFTFCNSWGTYSGNLGMFTIPYSYIGNSSLSSEWFAF